MIERWRLYIAHHRRHRHPHQHHHNNTTTPATILMKDIPLHRLVDTVIKRERTRERFAVVVCLFALARSHPISSHRISPLLLLVVPSRASNTSTISIHALNG